MRILHTMLRVGNLDRSIDFYTSVLGMRLLRRNDYPEGKFTLAFVGFDDESSSAVLELTCNWGVDQYDLGNGFGHIAIEVQDAGRACEEVRQRGGRVTREAGPMKHGTTVIAFVEDPATKSNSFSGGRAGKTKRATRKNPSEESPLPGWRRRAVCNCNPAIHSRPPKGSAPGISGARPPRDSCGIPTDGQAGRVQNPPAAPRSPGWPKGQNRLRPVATDSCR